MGQESRRKIVHISMVGWAFLIGWVPPLYISLLALAALLFNIFLLPVLTSRGLERKEDLELGFSPGMIAYPAVVLLLSLIFFRQQVFLAIAWGAMAFGDGFASVIGERYGKHRLGKMTDKTWEGTLSFMFFGLTGTLLLFFCLPHSIRMGIPLRAWMIAIAVAMVLGAAAETLRGAVNDNIIVPLVAAFASYFAIRIYQTGQFHVPENWVPGLVSVFVLAGVSYFSGKFDLKGALTGGGLTAMVFAGGNLPGLSYLFLFVIAGVAGSAWKFSEKQKLGLAQENRNRRTAIHVVANGGVAGVCGILGWVFPADQVLFLGMMAASLASALADTWSSEFGNIYGRKFVNIIGLVPDERGKDGVISLQGSLAGLAGSGLMALLYLSWTGSITGGLIVLLAGAAGSIIDSILGATLQRGAFMTNHSVNLVNTLFASLVFLLFYTIK